MILTYLTSANTISMMQVSNADPEKVRNADPEKVRNAGPETG